MGRMIAARDDKRESRRGLAGARRTPFPTLWSTANLERPVQPEVSNHDSQATFAQDLRSAYSADSPFSFFSRFGPQDRQLWYGVLVGQPDLAERPRSLDHPGNDRSRAPESLDRVRDESRRVIALLCQPLRSDAAWG